jgi:hypothetical protein
MDSQAPQNGPQIEPEAPEGSSLDLPVAEMVRIEGRTGDGSLLQVLFPVRVEDADDALDVARAERPDLTWEAVAAE